MSLERLGPVVQRFERTRVRSVECPTPITARADEIHAVQHPQMLGYRWLLKFQRIHDLADRALAGRQVAEDVTATRLGNGVEDVGVCGGAGHTSLYIPI